MSSSQPRSCARAWPMIWRRSCLKSHRGCVPLRLSGSHLAEALAQLDEVAAARHDFALSFGSCSFTEPIDDLRHCISYRDSAMKHPYESHSRRDSRLRSTKLVESANLQTRISHSEFTLRSFSAARCVAKPRVGVPLETVFWISRNAK